MRLHRQSNCCSPVWHTSCLWWSPHVPTFSLKKIGCTHKWVNSTNLRVLLRCHEHGNEARGKWAMSGNCMPSAWERDCPTCSGVGAHFLITATQALSLEICGVSQIGVIFHFCAHSGFLILSHRMNKRRGDHSFPIACKRPGSSTGGWRRVHVVSVRLAGRVVLAVRDREDCSRHRNR